MANSKKSGRLTYEAAGVNASAGEEAVARIRSSARSTFRAEVVGDIGGFGGLWSQGKTLLVASTDGVGTKAYVASELRRYDTIGLDLVAMSVDDIAVQGAEPLFFLDYVSVGVIDPDMIEALVAGVADGCRQAGCALLGGEMSEHPGAMEPGEFDFVGFAVGEVAESDLLPSGVQPGDAVIGIASTGLRCNGYALAREALIGSDGRRLDEAAWPGATRSLADELLHPSVIYAPVLPKLRRNADVHALAHVTSTGIAGNLQRVLPSNCAAVIRRGTWDEPRIFSEIQSAGDVPDKEMEYVFNLGLGMLAVVAPSDVQPALNALASAGHDAWEVGEIGSGNGSVSIE